ncbi:unnamed protein product [Paramecium octaurelia]|uniref:Uncharacterized protein n=1 Tax=Paramecium octaurelia TaxID=43137 RepID=A0A8S1VI57_PAROT|nr:unnamed protein product [Paramecium octaurelia]
MIATEYSKCIINFKQLSLILYKICKQERFRGFVEVSYRQSPNYCNFSFFYSHQKIQSPLPHYPVYLQSILIQYWLGQQISRHSSFNTHQLL